MSFWLGFLIGWIAYAIVDLAGDIAQAVRKPPVKKYQDEITCPAGQIIGIKMPCGDHEITVNPN